METRKYRSGYVRALPDDDSRTVRFIISDESVDRHNSVIRSDAWDLKAFVNSPIAGWSHDVYGGWRAPDPDNIIGTWKVWIEEKELIGDLTFEDAETNPKAEKLFRKVKNGTLNAVSVGFMPVKEHEGDEEKGEVKDVTYYDLAELVEVSLVGIPSNKNARKKALDNGDIPELMEELISEALGDKFSDEEIEKLTIKGLFKILRGGEAEEVEYADTGGVVDTDARDKRLQRIRNINKYLELEEGYKNEFKRSY